MIQTVELKMSRFSKINKIECEASEMFVVIGKAKRFQFLFDVNYRKNLKEAEYAQILRTTNHPTFLVSCGTIFISLLT